MAAAETTTKSKMNGVRRKSPPEKVPLAGPLYIRFFILPKQRAEDRLKAT